MFPGYVVGRRQHWLEWRRQPTENAGGPMWGIRQGSREPGHGSQARRMPRRCSSHIRNSGRRQSADMTSQTSRFLPSKHLTAGSTSALYLAGWHYYNCQVDGSRMEQSRMRYQAEHLYISYPRYTQRYCLYGCVHPRFFEATAAGIMRNIRLNQCPSRLEVHRWAIVHSSPAPWNGAARGQPAKGACLGLKDKI